jgi:mRNA-degrading endonuclease RelE of RelBE toxin-antitoxin system
MTFSYATTRQFDKKFHKLTRKNQALKDQVFEKILEIIENPEIGVPKRHELKGLSGVHVDPFVIIYAIIGDRIGTCLAPDQSFLNLPQNVFRPGKLNNMVVILIH